MQPAGAPVHCCPSDYPYGCNQACQPPWSSYDNYDDDDADGAHDDDDDDDMMM